VLAVEVLRQTPIHHVRYLDIIGITRDEQKLFRGGSEEFLNTLHSSKNSLPAENSLKQPTIYRREFSHWLNCVQPNEERSLDYDMKNMKIRRAQRVRPKLPFAETWQQLHGTRTVAHRRNICKSKQNSFSLEDLRPAKQEKERILPKIVSDESGISSGDENNNLTSDASQTSQEQEPIYVSVREKKQFFESLNDLTHCKKSGFDRSNSINNIAINLQPSGISEHQRACSMQDLSSNVRPVRQIKRFFEVESNSCEDLSSGKNEWSQEGTAEKARSSQFVCPLKKQMNPPIFYASIEFCKISTPRIDEENYENVLSLPQKTMSEECVNSIPNQSLTDHTPTLLIERKLQRGERKLTKLRIQIAEVEETIRTIAKDLHRITPNTLKR